MLWLAVTLLAGYILITWYRRRQKLSDFPNRHVFITGCDTGFGNLLAIQLDEMGFRVFAGCLTGKGEEELRKKASSRLVTIPLDVTNEKSIQEAVQNVRQHLPKGKGLWGLVNNAGVLESSGMAEWLKKSDDIRTLDVNFFGMVEVTRMFLPLVRRERGRVVNMSSVAGSCPIPVLIPYCISKHAVEVFSDSLRFETQTYGVSVHLVIPEGFQTNITDAEGFGRNIRAVFGRVDSEVKELYGEEYPDKLINIYKGIKQNKETYLVVDAYVDALVSMYPKNRYRVGFGAKTVMRILSWLPDWLPTWAFSSKLPTLAGNGEGH